VVLILMVAAVVMMTMMIISSSPLRARALPHRMVNLLLYRVGGFTTR
jgi:hypothetical protein